MSSHFSLFGEILISLSMFLREPLLNHNGCRWEPRFNVSILVQELLFDRIFNAWKPLLVLAVLVRKLLLVRVVDYPSQRGITVTYAQQSSTSSAERAIVQSVHILRREFVIHDCNVGPITWGNR